MTKNPTWHSDLRNFPKKNCQFSSFLTFSMSVEKNCLHYTDTFLAKSKKASKKSVKRRLGAQFTVERAFERAFLSCLAEIFVYIFQLCFRLLCRNSVFQCFSRKKKKWSRVFSEFLAMILAINWKFDTSAKF